MTTEPTSDHTADDIAGCFLIILILLVCIPFLLLL